MRSRARRAPASFASFASAAQRRRTPSAIAASAPRRRRRRATCARLEIVAAPQRVCACGLPASARACGAGVRRRSAPATSLERARERRAQLARAPASSGMRRRAASRPCDGSHRASAGGDAPARRRAAAAACRRGRRSLRGCRIGASASASRPGRKRQQVAGEVAAVDRRDVERRQRLRASACRTSCRSGRGGAPGVCMRARARSRCARAARPAVR